EAELLLTLGRLCVQRELWGKAQSYLEASLATRPTQEAHVALAKLHERFGRSAEAGRHFRASADLGQRTAAAASDPESGELLLRVARSRRDPCRKRRGQLRNLGCGERDPCGGGVLLHVFTPLRPRDRNDVLALGEHPRERDLRRLDLAARCDGLERPQQ